MMAQRFLDREGILIVLLAVLSLAFLVSAGIFLWNPPREEPVVSIPETATEPTPTAPPTTVDTTPSVPPGIRAEIAYPGEEGVSVLDLLKRDHTVKLDSELLLFGSIVLAIDGIEAKSDEVWLFYRDSIPGDRSPDVCITHDDEDIRWVLKHRR